MESKQKKSNGFVTAGLVVSLLLLAAALVFFILKGGTVAVACLIAASVLCVLFLILFLVGHRKPAEKKAEPKPEPAVETAEETAEEETPAEEAEETAEGSAAEEAEETADEAETEAEEDADAVSNGEGVGLKESLAIASHAHRTEKMSKAYIADYLRSVYPDNVELNERVNATTTGLPLADTHYVTGKDGKKLCFVYVYETEGAMMLLLKTKDPLGKEFQKEHHSVRRSAFPKAKDAWYSVVVDDSLSNGQLEDMIDRTIALYTGEEVQKKTKHIVAPIHTVSHVTVAEAQAMVTDEQAEDAIEEAVTEHTGKKGIVNVDTLSNAFDEGDTVTVAKLREMKLIPPSVGQVKLLARGTLNKVLHIELQDFSLEAVKMVIATGGTVKHV